MRTTGFSAVQNTERNTLSDTDNNRVHSLDIGAGEFLSKSKNRHAKLSIRRCFQRGFVIIVS